MTSDIAAGGGSAEPDELAGFADRMNSLPKYVVSTTLEMAAWNNSRLIKGNVAEEVAKLKQHDLVDEYRLMIHPVVVGHGKRLFQDGVDTTTLCLVESKTFPSGVIVLTYQAGRGESP